MPSLVNAARLDLSGLHDSLCLLWSCLATRWRISYQVSPPFWDWSAIIQLPVSSYRSYRSEKVLSLAFKSGQSPHPRSITTELDELGILPSPTFPQCHFRTLILRKPVFLKRPAKPGHGGSDAWFVSPHACLRVGSPLAAYSNHLVSLFGWENRDSIIQSDLRARFHLYPK